MFLILPVILFYSICIKHVFGTFRYAELGEYPSTISIRSKQNQTHFCGGSLIDQFHAITAASCLYQIKDNTSAFEIMGGDIYLYESVAIMTLTRHRFGFSVIIHEFFNPITKKHNIAIMRLTKSVNPTFALKPIIRQTGPTLSGIVCQIVGWGSRNMRGPPSLLSNKLMVTEVIVSYFCSNEDTGSESGFCVTINLMRKSCGNCTPIPKFCQGDYGGAMLCNGRLAAIITCNSLCYGDSQPKRLTEVSQYNAWIDRIISNPIYYSGTKEMRICIKKSSTVLWSGILLFSDIVFIQQM